MEDEKLNVQIVLKTSSLRKSESEKYVESIVAISARIERKFAITSCVKMGVWITEKGR